MANSYTNLIPTILTEALAVLRETAASVSTVNSTYESDAKAPGSSITIPVPVAQSVAAVTPANTPPANTDQTPTTVSIALNHWHKTDFQMSDKDAREIASGNYKNTQSAESVRALANQIDADLFASAYDMVDNSQGVANHVGTAGTTPFADTAALKAGWTAGARKLLNRGLSPSADRFVVLDEDAEAEALSLSQFTNANERGDQGGMVEGAIGQKLGATWLMNQNVPSFTGGTLTNGSGKLAKSNGVVAAGDTTVAIDDSSLSGTLVKGDVFTVAGDTGHYVCTGDDTASGNAIAAVGFYPAARDGWADNAVITFAADHVLNLAYHRNAFGLVMAPAEAPDGVGGSIVERLTDPQTGVTLQLEISREYFQTTWRFSMLYGVACIRPGLACRILG
tara:strand:+ start:20165 stop:21346 length:1182 start_codon:yes stop_codon:yes gene_type:complete